MIWFTTILTFIIAVVVAMLAFLIFSHRDQIRAALRKQQRTEARIPLRIGLELFGPGEPLEVTFTENVSRHGARVVTKTRRRPDDSVLVKLPQEGHRSSARITYCQPLKGDEFAIGLQFSLAVYNWTGFQ